MTFSFLQKKQSPATPNEDIAQKLRETLRLANEAYLIAASEWGARDDRAQSILNVWASADSVLRLFGGPK